MKSIHSTIDLPSASRGVWDAIVIGSGPAGSAAAVTLAQSRLKVLIVDKAEHPRFKVCGCCLNDVAVAVLESIGFKRQLDALHAVPIDKIELHSGRCNVRLNLSHGRVVSRMALDAALVQHALERGVEYLSRTTASVGALSDSGDDGSRVVELTCGEESVSANTRCVVVADGLNGHSLDRLNLLPVTVSSSARIGAGAVAKQFPDDLFEDGIIYMTCGAGGYVGMVKLEDSTLDVAAAFDRSYIQSLKDPGQAANRLIRHTRLAEFDLSKLHWHGTAALTRRRSAVSAPGIFVVGDAASYAEPFTGEGISWALTSGASVCAVIQDYLSSQIAVGKSFKHSSKHSNWDILHDRLIARKQRSSMLLAKVLRYPLIVEGVTRLLSAAPYLANPVVRSINSAPNATPLFRGSA